MSPVHDLSWMQAYANATRTAEDEGTPPYVDPTDKVLRELGQRLRDARVASGLTQEEAASKAGIDYKCWQRLESGHVNPTVKTLVRAAGAVGISFWALTRG
jgi:DNA-binding XRE family transcriptional regulator